MYGIKDTVQFGLESSEEELMTRQMDEAAATYNFDTFRVDKNRNFFHLFQTEVVRTGVRAPDFTLPDLDGGEVTLSALRGQPVMIEFGSIT